MNSRNHKETLFERIRNDSDFAAEYVSEAFNEGSPDVFYLALKDVIDARGGMSEAAKAVQVGRESLYKSLSHDGNPAFLTIRGLLNFAGLDFCIMPVHA